MDCERQSVTVENHCDDAFKELVIRLEKRMETIEKHQACITNRLDKLIELMSTSGGGSDAGVHAVKAEVEEDFVVRLIKHTDFDYSMRCFGELHG